jgi:hypothetical protein
VWGPALGGKRETWGRNAAGRRAPAARGGAPRQHGPETGRRIGEPRFELASGDGDG